MKGQYKIVIQNNKLHYELTIKRNLTIIRGDSATGKTTLINLIEQAANLGDSSGVDLYCERPCRTLSGADWRLVLNNIHEQIIFIDEENQFIKTQEFAAAVKTSDNYFVLITREDLPNLPYSVEEIYGLHAFGKYHELRRTFNEMYRIYGTEVFDGKVAPDIMVVEDANAGYEFFASVCADNGKECITAKGKSNLKYSVPDTDKEILVTADGAAIGPEMNELYQLMLIKKNLHCYLPESFEWMILKSGLIDGKIIQDILEHPWDFVDNKQYFSWERFFNALLVKYTRDNYLQYNKTKLNPVYLHVKNKQAILDVMQGVEWEYIGTPAQ